MIESAGQPRLNDVVFVYGTLRRYPGSQSSRLRPSRWIGNTTIQGNLYLVGSLPGLVLSDRASDLVHGEVYQMLSPSKTLAQLDRYEGCGRSHGQRMHSAGCSSRCVCQRANIWMPGFTFTFAASSLRAKSAQEIFWSDKAPSAH